MARRKADPRKAYLRRRKEGRGQGVGKDYKPSLTIRDVPSDGWLVRNKVWGTSRINQLLSGLELKIFYILIWFDSVTDIKEQFGLDPKETELIAHELGVKHSLTGDFHEMTTDFLVTQTYQGGHWEFGLSCKPKGRLTIRAREKLSIERIYWERRNVAFFINTEDEINNVLAENVEKIYQDWFEDNLSETIKKNKEEIGSVLLSELAQNPDDIFRDITSRTDRRLGLEPGMTLSLAKHMIARKELPVDMFVKLNFCLPLKILDSSKV